MSHLTRESATGRTYLDLQNLVTMYTVERRLSRMSRSSCAEDFILKGGMPLASFGPRRSTLDADGLARSMAADRVR